MVFQANPPAHSQGHSQGHLQGHLQGPARGALFIYSAPTALVPHIEWAIGNVLGAPVSLEWSAQPVSPGALRTESKWQGAVGSASKIASAMRGWHYVRFEITEEASAENDGARFQGTPELGIHHSIMGVHGDVYVNEDRIRASVKRALKNGTSLEEELEQILGTPWDEELEPFRYAGDQSSIRWLKTGSS